jgi:hypothetical protein
MRDCEEVEVSRRQTSFGGSYLLRFTPRLVSFVVGGMGLAEFGQFEFLPGNFR